MELNEKQLRDLITRVMELTLENITPPEKKNILVVLSGNDLTRFAQRLKEIRKSGKYRITVAVTKKQMEDEGFGKMVLENAHVIADAERAGDMDIDYDRIVFPVMPRNILAKAALCISDTYETILIQRAFESGVRLKLLKGALEPFTGNEPPKYQEKILGYVRCLLEYGFEMEEDAEKR